MPDTQPARTRFAPSPTGLLHIGGVRTALYDWLLARRTGGQFILRIEDTDRDRYSPEAEASIRKGLEWLGLTWDEGPGAGGPHAPYVQSQRLEIYRQAAEQLIRDGHAYRCTCTKERLEALRAAQQEAGEPTGYDRHCRDLSDDERARQEEEGLPYVVRFAMPREGSVTFNDAVRGEITFENALLDDFVILKSDGFPTYQLAAPLDDVRMGVTHIIRGEEWISSATKNILLTRALGYEPPVYAHLPLILGTDKKKLSKRHGATSLMAYAEQGYLPEALLNFLALLGWSEGEDNEIYSVGELVSRFSLEGVARNPAIFDLQKLEWMNGVYIRQMPVADLAARCLPFLQRAGLIANPMPEEMRPFLEAVVAVEQERMKRLDEIPHLAAFFFQETLEWEDKALRRAQAEGAQEILADVAVALDALSDGGWTLENVEAAVRGVIAARGVKAGEVVHPVRAAVTGRTVGPGLFEAIHILGRARSVHRLRNTP